MDAHSLLNEKRAHQDYEHIVAMATIMNAVISRDGDAWCCLTGENLQGGIAGFSKRSAFDAIYNWHQSLMNDGVKPPQPPRTI